VRELKNRHHERVEKGGVGDQDLVTARLWLRRPTPADIDLIHTVHSDARACVYNPADMLTTGAEAEDLYYRWDEHWQHYGLGYWIVHGNRRGLGFCGVKVMTLNDRGVLNLFYRLDPSAWGHGVATEAATSVVEWVDTHRLDDPLVARVRPTNAASQRVAVHAGLRRAEHLDTQGEDGLDWIYTRRWH
jgi:[ribosomal protein S5]-alanine N-acetyltransferase